jgi:mannose-6-phosphate isomerase-like protein (cupin superfamily)
VTRGQPGVGLLIGQDAGLAATDGDSEESPMKGFVDDIEERTERNSDFRRVLYTGKQMQLVLMALRPGEEIGEEIHRDRDQFFRVEKGKGEVWIDGHKTRIKSDVAIVVPAGARHNVKNTGAEALKLYTLYAPPEHADGTVHATKADAQASTEHFDGTTTE